MKSTSSHKFVTYIVYYGFCQYVFNNNFYYFHMLVIFYIDITELQKCIKLSAECKKIVSGRLRTFP